MQYLTTAVRRIPKPPTPNFPTPRGGRISFGDSSETESSGYDATEVLQFLASDWAYWSLTVPFYVCCALCVTAILIRLPAVSGSHTVVGKVTNIRETPTLSSLWIFIAPLIVYHYRIGSREYTGTGRPNWPLRRYRMDRTVEVHYSPALPSYSTLDNPPTIRRIVWRALLRFLLLPMVVLTVCSAIYWGMVFNVPPR